MSNKVEITIPLTLTLILPDNVFLSDEQTKTIGSNVGDLVSNGEFCPDNICETICESLGGYSGHKEMYNLIWESGEFNWDLKVSE